MMENQDMTFNEYQRRALTTDVLPDERDDDRLILPLLGLAGEVGSLAAEWKKRRRDLVGYRAFSEELGEDLGDILWYAAILADRAGFKLSDIATSNLSKANDEFSQEIGPNRYWLFDDDRIEEERLPRHMTVLFEESQIGEGSEQIPTVSVYLGGRDGVQVGDPLDDNSLEQDDYRFHDVFHLAHMAVLGWSPVMRSILVPKRKRRDGVTDRVEDGGRAIAIEEGLTAAVFAEARRHNYFKSADRIPSSLIKLCTRMTSHLEVSSRTAGDWQRAIYTGYRAYNSLIENRGGLVTVDLNGRDLVVHAQNEKNSDE